MYFEPKPEGSGVVAGGFNCRAFGVTPRPGESAYTMPLVTVLYGTHPADVGTEYEAFASERGRMIIGIGEARWDDDEWYLTVIYQERVDPNAE